MMERTVVSAYSEASVSTVIWVSGIQWVRTRAVVKAFFKCFKGRMALIGEMARGTLVGKMCKRNCDFRISINEVMVEVGKAEERLNILDFPWYWPILDDLDFVWGLSHSQNHNFNAPPQPQGCGCLARSYVHHV